MFSGGPAPLRQAAERSLGGLPFRPHGVCRVSGSYSCQPRLYLPYEIVSHYTLKTGFVKGQCKRKVKKLL